MWSRRIPDQFCEQALPNNKLAPHLAKRGIQMVRYQRNDCVGVVLRDGASRWSAATRPTRWRCAAPSRWRSDVEREIRPGTLRAGDSRAVARGSQQVWGYDPAFKSEMSEFDRAKARALLDLYGYVDRDGRRLARTARRHRVDDRVRPRQPDKVFRDLYEQWDVNMRRSACASVPLIRAVVRST
jgi:hypothetical protein